MQMILLQRVGRLGQMGDIVNVRDGYARNYLLPQHMALRATEENKKVFESKWVQLEAENLERKNEAQAVADKLDGRTFILIRAAGDTGQLYGSVSTRDIASAVTEDGVSIHRNQVIIEKPIKTLGLTPAQIQLHPEVFADIRLNVARSDDEAEKQARGENVVMVQDETLELETFDPDAEEGDSDRGAASKESSDKEAKDA